MEDNTDFEELFRNPPARYRGTPFWAWNCKLNEEQIEKQVEYFKKMGMGGFHIHVRTGLDTPYMGKEYLHAVKTCMEKAKQEGMLTYLYDEDRWPSGVAGGVVTKKDSFRGRHLFFKPRYHDRSVLNPRQNSPKERIWLVSYEITLESGYLKEARMLSEEESKNPECDPEKIWDLYLELRPKEPTFNNESYVDTLNPEATREFIEATHELYYQELGREFGRSIPSIFTDEPQMTNYTRLGFANERKGVSIPFTDCIPEMYRERYQENFFAIFPELVWETADGRAAKTRYRYLDLLAGLFADSYAGVLGQWCEGHDIALTGHLMEEDSLGSQTAAMGEAMRSYQYFGLPGIDVLCDKREYATAKQAQSASHQYGKAGVLSELYGVTNWDFDFRRHKLGGDWQAALGVTTRVHHLAWMSMAGEAKRDYPASMFYQSPWYQEYPMVEDHFARVHTALMEGKPHARIAVIHPVESYWLHFGPNEQTYAKREELETNFKNVIEWLLFAQLDFDFVCESQLPKLYRNAGDGRFHVGEMAYDVVLVPSCETIRSTTLQALTEYRNGGGQVIIAGEAPRDVDAEESKEAETFAKECVRIAYSRSSIVNALEPYRDVEVRKADGVRADQILYQMRDLENGRFVFFANGRQVRNEDSAAAELLTIRIRGEWEVTLYQTMDGTVEELPSRVENGDTVFGWRMHEEDSLLVRLSERRNSESAANLAATYDIADDAAWEKVAEYREPVEYELEEPNVLLLDMAEYRLDGGEWQPKEEILRIDDKLRESLGMPTRRNRPEQPYTVTKRSEPEHVVELRYMIETDKHLDELYLAMEQPQNAEIRVNGIPLKQTDCGYYVDESIRVLKLLPVPAGEITISVKLPFAKWVNLESMYLLGDFGVRVSGTRPLIIRRPVRIGFGDVTAQGMPFYGGNLSYRLNVTIPEDGEYAIAVTKFRAPLVGVSVDGKKAGSIAYAPYRAELGFLTKGEHVVELTSFGNRINTFGQVHLADEKMTWFGGLSWRQGNESFQYNYRFWRNGILREPELWKKK